MSFPFHLHYLLPCIEIHLLAYANDVLLKKVHLPIHYFSTEYAFSKKSIAIPMLHCRLYICLPNNTCSLCVLHPSFQLHLLCNCNGFLHSLSSSSSSYSSSMSVAASSSSIDIALACCHYHCHLVEIILACILGS